MQENGKFYIALNGVKYEVSKEAHEVFYQAERKIFVRKGSGAQCISSTYCRNGRTGNGLFSGMLCL